jgi:hypothetical protein
MPLLGVARIDPEQLCHPVPRFGPDLHIMEAVHAIDVENRRELAVMARVFGVSFNRKRANGAGEALQSFPNL